MCHIQNGERACKQLSPPMGGKEATPEEIIGFCGGEMAAYVNPKSVVFVQELPLNPSGKISKPHLRKIYLS